MPPPAYRSLPDTASPYTLLSIPEPRADQLLPSHLAMLAAGMPPPVPENTFVNPPPTYRSLPDAASTCTGPSIPEPSADQLLPSHLAMKLAAVPPAFVKPPPAYTLLPDTASARTMLSIPEPRAD